MTRTLSRPAVSVPAALAVGAAVLLGSPSAALAATAPRTPAVPARPPAHPVAHPHTTYAVLPTPTRLRTTATAASTSLLLPGTRSLAL